MLIDRHTHERWTTCFECGATAWIVRGADACESCQPEELLGADLRSINSLTHKPRPLRAPQKDLGREDRQEYPGRA